MVGVILQLFPLGNPLHAKDNHVGKNKKKTWPVDACG
jgi:hypothetical protein